MEYLELCLELRPATDGRFAVRAAWNDREEEGWFEVPAGEGSGPGGSGAESGARNAVLEAPGDAPAEGSPGACFRATGRDRRRCGVALFDSLFDGPPGGSFRSLWERVEDRRRRGEAVGLRLRLVWDGDDPRTAPLDRLPWEALCWGPRSLTPGADPRFSVVRSPRCPVSPRELPVALEDGERLHLLAVRGPDAAGLDLDREEHILRRLAEGERWNVAFTRWGSEEEVERETRRRAVHGLHFLGHGLEARDDDRGGVVFESPGGEPHHLTPARLVQLFGAAESLRFLVLNGCSTSHRLPGAALRAGVPAVVAMARPVRDEVALCFADAFYEWLSRTGCLERAVAEGRRALGRRSFDDWSVPVLTLHPRLAAGRLIGPGLPVQESERPEAPESATPRPAPRVQRLVAAFVRRRSIGLPGGLSVVLPVVLLLALAILLGYGAWVLARSGLVPGLPGLGEGGAVSHLLSSPEPSSPEPSSPEPSPLDDPGIRRIDSLHRDRNGVPEEVCSDQGAWSPRRVDDVIDDLREGHHRYVVLVDGAWADVGVVEGGEERGPYLRTRSDDAKGNNLSRLPDCDLEAQLEARGEAQVEAAD